MYHDNKPSGVGNSRGAKLLDGNTSGKARRQSQELQLSISGGAPHGLGTP